MTKTVTFCLLFCLATFACGSELEQVNDVGGNFSFVCPPGQHIDKMKSTHVERKDRIWYFGCTPGYANGTCTWTEKMEYNVNKCPNGGVIAGLSSEVFKPATKYSICQRRWQLLCCEVYVSAPLGNQCQTTGYLNDYFGPMDYKLPQGYALTAFYTVMDFLHPINYDTRCKVSSCKYATCSIEQMTIQKYPAATKVKEKVLSMQTTQSCAAGATFSMSINTDKEITNSITLTDTHEMAMSVSTSVTVGVETGGGIWPFSASLQATVGTSTSHMESHSKEITTSKTESVNLGFNLDVPAPAAAILVPYMHVYQTQAEKVPVEYLVTCDNKDTFYLNSTITLKSEIHQHVQYMHKIIDLSNANCSMSTRTCISQIHRTSSPHSILQEFENCFQ